MNPPPVPPHSDHYKASMAVVGGAPHGLQRSGASQTPDRQLPKNPVGGVPGARHSQVPASHHHTQPVHHGALHGTTHGASHGAARVQDSSALEWESREEARRRELEEVKARAAQMEKTMRWWSDCTANWREKWSKVRGERNEARDECRQLRARLESTNKELVSVRRSQIEVTDEIKNLKTERDSLRSVISESESLRDKCDSLADLQKVLDSEERIKPLSVTEQNDIEDNNEFTCKTPCGSSSKLDRPSLVSQEADSKENVANRVSGISDSSFDIIKKLQEELDSARLQIEQETREKETLCSRVEKLQTDLNSLTEQLDEAVRSKNEASLEIIKLKKYKQERIEQIASDLEDETPTTTGNADARLADLRKELEKLQAENADEWAQREKLETEKQSLERENRKLRSDLDHLREELSRRGREQSGGGQLDTEASQDELSIKVKELADLRHAHVKLKKCIQDKTSELEHARSRADQYETEVKKLRGRIEELKQDLTKAEDEADRNAHQMRRLERENDDLQQQVEGLSLQVEHLHNRLPRSPSSLQNSSIANLAEVTKPDVGDVSSMQAAAAMDNSDEETDSVPKVDTQEQKQDMEKEERNKDENQEELADNQSSKSTS